MKTLLLVGLGGFLGTLFRYGFNVLIKSPNFPISTFLANIFGCLLIGLVIGLAQKMAISDNIKLFLTTGFCGGFTTFSAFALENQKMMASGNIGQALVYILASLVLSILMVYAGLIIGEKLI